VEEISEKEVRDKLKDATYNVAEAQKWANYISEAIIKELSHKY